jgi:hypothetical protein
MPLGHVTCPVLRISTTAVENPVGIGCRLRGCDTPVRTFQRFAPRQGILAITLRRQRVHVASAVGVDATAVHSIVAQGAEVVARTETTAQTEGRR